MRSMIHTLRLLAVICSVSAAFAWGGEAARPDWLSAGRRMVRVPQVARMHCLSGRAPQGGEKDTYCVTNGAETLWLGGAGESFSVPCKSGTRSLYLVSLYSRNKAWQDLQWSEGDWRWSTGSKHREMGAAQMWGFLPGETDAGPALRRIISELQNNGPDAGPPVLYLKKGEYHFYPQGALPVSLGIFGHAPQETLPVAVPLVNLWTLTLDGQGSTFVIHGRMLPVLLMDSIKVTLRNIDIRYADEEQAEAAAARPFPTVLIYRAKDVALENVRPCDSAGVALLAQRSENIAVKGEGITAEGIRISDCRGRVDMPGESAPSVHTTRLSIEKVESPQEIIAAHPQEAGYELICPGERIQFAMKQTQEKHPTPGVAAAVKKLDETHLHITLTAPLPEGIGAGDFIRNADWQPTAPTENSTDIPHS